MLLVETLQPNIHSEIDTIAKGWGNSSIQEGPITMICREAAKAGPEAHSTWKDGLDQKAKMAALKEKSSEIALTRDEKLNIAINDSYGFMVLWGKKAGTSTAIACLSNGLIGFDGQNPQKQRECGLDILGRIVSQDDATYKPYGPHKMVAFFETDLDEETMLRRFVDAQAEPTYKYFPQLREEEQLLDAYRHQQLINLEPGMHRPFIDVSQGKTTPLIKAYQNNGKEYFEYGYEERAGEFIGINLDNNEQPLRELYEGATLDDTGKMLRAIAEFLKGAKGKNRFVLQLDFGADAACCNLSFNAQQNINIFSENNIFNSEIEVPSLLQQAFQDEPDYMTNPDAAYLPFYKNKIDKAKDTCQECGKSRDEETCNCKDKNKS